MNRSLFLCLALAVATQTNARTDGINSGSNLTLGPSSNSHSLFAGSSNPAAASLVVDEDERWRLNYLPTLTTTLEVGNVDNFVDELDELIDLIEDPSTNTESVDEVLDRFNAVLVQMGDEGYLKSSVRISAPLFPVYYRSDALGGTLFSELTVSTQIGLSVLDAPLEYNEQNDTFNTSTSAYVKSGIDTTLAMGYSRELPSVASWLGLDSGTLLGGVKMKVSTVELSKQLFALQLLDGRDIEEVIEDEYDSNLVKTTEVGLDIGLLYQTENYRIGATISDINEPSFDYGEIGVNCGERDDGSVALSNCENAAYFTQVLGEISSNETHKRHAVVTLDGLYSFNEKWSVTSAIELAKYDDMVGRQNQWFHIAAAYDSQSRWMPSTRVGFQKNLAGSKLGSVNFGFTFFKTLTFDVEWGLDSVSVDGSTVPRRLGFALGLQESF